MTALMTDQQAVTPSFIPNPFVWGNFAEVFDRIPFFTYVWNTTQIAVLSTVGIVLSCVPVAYALARMRWKGRQVAFLLGALDADAAGPGDDRAALHPVGARRADRPHDAA